jgi:predicted alpha-1,6-mannanase (GH76 family)
MWNRTVVRRTILKGTAGATILAILGCGLAAVAVAPGTGLPAAAPPIAAYHQYADAAIQSFLLKFWNPSHNSLNDTYPGNGRLTGYWTYANGWRTVIANAQRTQCRRYAGLIETFYEGQDRRGWYAEYYDDENWMALALLHAYDVTREPRYLRQARILFADIQKGWDTSCCGTTPGGIWWDKAHTQKATASNAGPVIAACRLYAATRDDRYLSFAQQVYRYWWDHMVDAATYQVADHLNPDGTKVWWRFTYNEGLMIGAGRALYLATNDATYLADAHHVAGFMVRNEVTPTRYGPVLFDGTNEGCRGDCHQFKGPAFTFLSELNRDSPRSAYRTVLQASADALWNLARQSSLNLFAVDWSGPPQSAASEAQESAAAIALSEFARTQGPYPGPGVPSNRYEAEDATLHSLGLEDRSAGFSGWGYVTGWNADGQWVTFQPHLKSGAHRLTFRYAAGAGDAKRVILINGRRAGASLFFPGTGSWDNYRTVSVRDRFPAGLNRIRVTYDGSQGSRNPLNLDRMVVD